MKLQLSGKLYEIGDLECARGMGFRLELDGGTIELTGLTEKECRDLEPHLGQQITIDVKTVVSRALSR